MFCFHLYNHRNIVDSDVRLLRFLGEGSAMSHIDFALYSAEVKICVLCGKAPTQSSCHGFLWNDRSVEVTPAGRYPVGGLVGICSSCGRRGAKKREILAKWRQTAPRLIQIIPGMPVRLVARGYCDDARLIQVIRDTFEKIPEKSRRKILEYVVSGGYSVTGKGMRFEALGRWPRMGTCQGMNMDRGHAIRLRASYVNNAPIESLVGTIAHELAHTEQHAEDIYFEFADDCERDVEARLREWGFDAGGTDAHRQKLLDEVDQIHKFAKEMKAAIKKQKHLPSGNFVAAALSEASRARNMMIRSIDRWSGRG